MSGDTKAGTPKMTPRPDTLVSDGGVNDSPSNQKLTNEESPSVIG